jgi:hypothetical protein
MSSLVTPIEIRALILRRLFFWPLARETAWGSVVGANQRIMAAGAHLPLRHCWVVLLDIM